MTSTPETAEVRLPYWLSATDCALLHSLLSTLNPADSTTRGIMAELRAAKLRNELWPESNDIVRRSKRMHTSVLPVRLSAAEVGQLTTLPIPADLAAKLRRGKKTAA